MQNNQGKVTSIPLIDRGPIGERSRARNGKRADRARFWPAILISMIVVPMIVVLGFYSAIPSRAAGPATVNLGTAGDFVILAETGITTTGATQIVGDIGVSPIDSTAITGFGLIYTPGATYSTSALVTGNVYAADYADPTPTMLTTAVSDMQTAYTDAAGRTPDPGNTELYSGDVTGQTLTPGLYKWSTGVSVGAAGVTISGGASDVWIFQIAGTLNLASGAIVTLSGGALAANIFWQVAGQVTLGTTAEMKGIILCQTAIVLNTGATLEGRALAQSAVTLDANFVGPPGTVIPEFSQVLIPLVGMMFVVAIVSKVRNQRK